MANRAIPSAIKKNRGTFRGDRHRGEPTPPSGPAKKPAWITGLAAKHWKVIVSELPLDLLTRSDTIAMGLLVDALADYLESREIVEKWANKGGIKFLHLTDKKNLIQHPAKGVQNRAFDRLVKLLREFGMTPSSRATMHMTAASDSADEMAHLLFGQPGNLN